MFDNQTFYDWCIENNRQDLLDRWDYKLNTVSPSDVRKKSREKYWFKCDKNKAHKSESFLIFKLNQNSKLSCRQCNSFAQWCLDNDRQDLLDRWDYELNKKDPFEVSKKTKDKYWFKCLNNNNHKSECHHLFSINKNSEVQCLQCESFYNWCISNNRENILDLWDYELNKTTPMKVKKRSNKKYWFKCPRGLHNSELHGISYFQDYPQSKIHCSKCDSFAQYIIDNFGENYLKTIWCDTNSFNSWDCSRGSDKIAEFNCLNNENHKYKMDLLHFYSGNRCPYCSGKQLLKEESLGTKYPVVNKIWSNKNNKTQYDYFCNSHEKVWLKCIDGKHADYQKTVSEAVRANFKCPKCSEEKNVFVGFNMFYIKDDKKRKELHRLRNKSSYLNWRKRLLEKCDYTCQCCGYKSLYKMNVHHIFNFISNCEKRESDDNGIVLCENCHSAAIKGSFHNTYGTINNTPTQLEEYINNKRKNLNIKEKFSIDEYLRGRVLKPQEK